MKCLSWLGFLSVTFDCMLVQIRSKELSKKLREHNIAPHKQGTGYKKIEKELNVPRDTVGSIDLIQSIPHSLAFILIKNQRWRCRE